MAILRSASQPTTSMGPPPPPPAPAVKRKVGEEDDENPAQVKKQKKGSRRSGITSFVQFEMGNCAKMRDFNPTAPGQDGFDASSEEFQNFFFIPHIACVKEKRAEPDRIFAQAMEEDEKGTKTKAVRLTAKDEKEVQVYADIYNYQERLKACSGRDEMCYSVLNDEWASHPTWASEDSGFVAHRKNAYEEGLHRIEEERHDYDFNIEANQKVIQLLEPIGQQILSMNQTELANFRMPPKLGGSSQSIYIRILKKIYGSDKGQEVAMDLFKDPIAVLPTVLARLKQKDEEWRFTQVSRQNPYLQ
jgi:hypothetical protein